MFGVDFSELMVILVIALIIIGPERLPKVARTVGHLWGRAQRYVNGVKADIARDMAVEEFRQLQQQVQQEADNTARAVTQVAQTLDQQVQQIQEVVAQPAPESADASPPPKPKSVSPPQKPQAVSPPPPIAQQGQLELLPPAGQEKSPADP